ncbi:hypothetical protein RA307_12660 [Xanthobacteraceae bacterium Astr-EGSB]|uniref:hypothetical protein n=1 Tax=Astrobacterium formosum TaxID=3069710 RepID=UPI0027B863CD|nr:hypothetical protein [Xanthobacteraceae bacterium Astr-EGSB]
MTQAVETPQLGPDPFADDPFFKRGSGTHWNACIGRQGDEENYIDGYIDAAKSLAEAVIEKKLFGARDTLILPILYNARHAVELVLKFATDRLVGIGAVPSIEMRSHNVMAYWKHIETVGDEKLREELAALKPFVDSLNRIDADGQALRYHVTSAGGRSLDDRALANLEVIRESLDTLSNTISMFKNRTLTYLDEHATGTVTARCSRRDLATIANMLPRRDMWNSKEFELAKNRIKSRYRLSNTQLSLALQTIQRSRELNGLLGVESILLHLSDAKSEWLAKQWRSMHPARDDSGTVVSSFAAIEAILHNADRNGEVVNTVVAALTDDELADADAMFYIALTRAASEEYEDRVAATKRKHAAQDNKFETVEHLMSKTNFLNCFRLAAERLGRPSLARKLEQI